LSAEQGIGEFSLSLAHPKIDIVLDKWAFLKFKKSV
jgi:hypothetical protein